MGRSPRRKPPAPIRAEDGATAANSGPARRAEDEHRVALAAWAWSRPMAEATALSTFQRKGEAGREPVRGSGNAERNGRRDVPRSSISILLHIRSAPSGPVRSFSACPAPTSRAASWSFQQRFRDEDACRRYLFASRWPDGFACPRCGGQTAGEQSKRWLWEGRSCGHQTSVTAGKGMPRPPTPPRARLLAGGLLAPQPPRL